MTKFLFLLASITACTWDDPGPTYPVNTPGSEPYGGTNSERPDGGVLARSCTVSDLIYHADRTETLTLGLDCGTFGPGPESVSLTYARTLDRGVVFSDVATLKCANNFLNFVVGDAYGAETISKITGSDWAITCN